MSHTRMDTVFRLFPGPVVLWESSYCKSKAGRAQSVVSQRMTLNDVSSGLSLTLNGVLLAQRNEIQQNKENIQFLI